MKTTNETKIAKDDKGKWGRRSQWPEWWEEVPEWERQLIHTVMGMLKAAKRGPSPDVAAAARAWENDFRSFIKGRLMNRHRQLLKLRRKCKRLVPAASNGAFRIVKLISSPSTLRNRPNAFQDPD